jgi:hypothetical protein
VGIIAKSGEEYLTTKDTKKHKERLPKLPGLPKSPKLKKAKSYPGKAHEELI